ncbi:hypothetical protein BSKO_05354 [Bryopsis sp. KO-2023]|nr:hypothetical protein BSKO_05354 [Bryopsis sp. KO-2023]
MVLKGAVGLGFVALLLAACHVDAFRNMNELEDGSIGLVAPSRKLTQCVIVLVSQSLENDQEEPIVGTFLNFSTSVTVMVVVAAAAVVDEEAVGEMVADMVVEEEDVEAEGVGGEAEVVEMVAAPVSLASQDLAANDATIMIMDIIILEF